MGEEQTARYPRKRVVTLGGVVAMTRLVGTYIPPALAEWLKGNEAAALAMEFFHVSGELYCRQAGGGAALSLLVPWQYLTGEPTDLPMVSERGEYLFKVGRFPHGAVIIHADSPEDGTRYVLDVQ